MPHYKLYLPIPEQPFFYRFFASLLSILYRWIINFRNILYDKNILKSTKLPGTCISIGNITLGGTGKSPVLMELVQNLLDKNFQPVVLTRGYKSALKKNECMILLNGKIQSKNFDHEVSKFPDEAMMYSQRLPKVPIIISQNRTLAAQWFLKDSAQPTHWILDDGFQHRRLARDCDIVLLDSQSPWGNRGLLPLGSLREPIHSLKRAHCILFTRATDNTPLSEDSKIVYQITHAQQFQCSFDWSLRCVDKSTVFSKNHEPVLLMTGIAHPLLFLKEVEGKHIKVGHHYAVEDHENFDRKKMQDLWKSCGSILTTEKDYWRNPFIFQNSEKPCFVADLKITVKHKQKTSILDLIYPL